jgi:putative transposase
MRATLIAVLATVRSSVQARAELELEILTLRHQLAVLHQAQYLRRDRGAIDGSDFGQTLQGFGIEDVVSAPDAPWQNPFVERVIGSIRRECLDHVIVWNERSLRRTLRSYLDYYHRWRTHLSLDKDAPEPRPIRPPARGVVIERARVGGIHHSYERRAA